MKPQTQSLLRRILRTSKSATKGGIVLPDGLLCLQAETYRLQQVAIKIGRCLFYREQSRFMPYENCKDIRLCEHENVVPEFYRLSWEMSKANVNDPAASKAIGSILVADMKVGQAQAACHKVFSYRSAHVDGLHLYTLLFWQAFAFCMTFAEPIEKQ